jgi:transcriptional regulator with XRE-family HTH domain
VSAQAVSDTHFAERLRKLRIWQGWSQRELAEQTGGRCSLKTISDWENGRHKPVLGEPLRAVAEVLRVAPGWLLNGAKGDPHANA